MPIPWPHSYKYDNDKGDMCIRGGNQTCFDTHITPGSPVTGPSDDQTLVDATEKINEALKEVQNSHPPQGKKLAIIAEGDRLFLVWVKYVDDGEDELRAILGTQPSQVSAKE